MNNLTFLKLGGSLITQKDTPNTASTSIISRLAREIHAALSEKPSLKIILGHGSGSFGHMAATKYGTRQQVRSTADWAGFAEVWRVARQLNQIVLDLFSQEGLPIISFPPSASAIAHDGTVSTWDLRPVEAALEAGLLPLVYGDTVFDSFRGGTILSTEDCFFYMARYFKPDRILLAGLEEGVWLDFPQREHLLPEIDLRKGKRMSAALEGSAAVDVTGGMAEKVRLIGILVSEIPGLHAEIFSGTAEGSLYRSLLGEQIGTRIHA